MAHDAAHILVMSLKNTQKTTQHHRDQSKSAVRGSKGMADLAVLDGTGNWNKRARQLQKPQKRQQAVAPDAATSTWLLIFQGKKPFPRPPEAAGFPFCGKMRIRQQFAANFVLCRKGCVLFWFGFSLLFSSENLLFMERENSGLLELRGPFSDLQIFVCYFCLYL